MTFLYILLFILFLSILIVVHELGHLTAAKFFKVYCMDFSIGFGPALIHKKRKNGETYFSLRCIPFGGFVSMYGEGVELPEGVDVPISRSLEGIKKWKQAIIMAAGVIMNVVLAIIIFFISNQACVHYTYYLRKVDPIKENTLAYNVIDNSKTLFNENVILENGDGSIYYQFSTDGLLSFDEDHEPLRVAYALDTSAFTMDKRSYEDICQFYEVHDVTLKDGSVVPMANLTKPISLGTYNGLHVKSVKFNIPTCDLIENPETHQPEYVLETKEDHYFDVLINKENQRFAVPLGLSMYRNDEWYNFPKAFTQTFVDFGNASSALFKGLGSLFTPDGWKNVGGIVAIGVMTSNTLANQGIAQFLYIWGFISINLAIVNLLPFPGLDGWHLVVLAIEGISKKKIPLKAKNIVSLIGLGLLFVLMILIIIKDIIMLV